MTTTRTLQTRTLPMQITEQGRGPLVLLLHGFPESAYSWRHQLPVLAQAGYRAVAPNQRGYAGSGRPHAVEAYDVVALADDAIAVLDALGEEQCVLVGHDWGSSLAWHVALLHPERVRAVVGMSVPFGGRGKRSPLAGMREAFKDAFFYMLYFQEPGVAEAELEPELRRFLRTFYLSASGEAGDERRAFLAAPPSSRLLDTVADTGAMPSWLSEADLDHYVREFEESGLRGPLNWYRNFDRSFELTAALDGKRIEQPALFVAGDRDPVILWSQRALARMPDVMPRLSRSLMLQGCGHWVQQERPAEVNAALLQFLGEL